MEGGNNTCTRTGITDMRWDLATSTMMMIVMLVVMILLSLPIILMTSNHSDLRPRQRSVLSWSTQPDERRSCLSTLVHFTSAPAYKSTSGWQDDKDKITMMH